MLVNTLDLRDDSTLHVRGSKRTGAVSRQVRRRDRAPFQRFNPADGCNGICRRTAATCRAVQAHRRQAIGRFPNTLDFVSEAAYRRADRFYQFGVFEEQIESRCQYYEIELLPGDDGTTPSIAEVTNRSGATTATINPTATTAATPRCPRNGWTSIPSILAGRSPTILNDPNYIDLGSGNLIRNRRCQPTMSMYEQTTRFRLLERTPLGLIAIFHDKRDDELQPASDLPREVVLVEDFEDTTIPDAWEQETGGWPWSRLRRRRARYGSWSNPTSD